MDKALLSPTAMANILQNILSWSIEGNVELYKLERASIKAKKNEADKVRLNQTITVEGSTSYKSLLKFIDNVENMPMMSQMSEMKFSLSKGKVEFKYVLNIYGISLDDEEI